MPNIWRKKGFLPTIIFAQLQKVWRSRHYVETAAKRGGSLPLALVIFIQTWNPWCPPLTCSNSFQLPYAVLLWSFPGPAWGSSSFYRQYLSESGGQEDQRWKKGSSKNIFWEEILALCFQVWELNLEYAADVRATRIWKERDKVWNSFIVIWRLKS